MPGKQPNRSEDVRQMIQHLLEATNTDSGHIVVDDCSRILHWSENLESLLGWKASEMDHQPLQSIMPAEHRQAHVFGMERFLSTGQTHVLEKSLDLPALHRAGHMVNLTLSIRHIDWRGRHFFHACVLVPHTPRSKG